MQPSPNTRQALPSYLRGVIVSHETIRLWSNRFGAHFAACIRRVLTPNCAKVDFTFLTYKTAKILLYLRPYAC